MPQWCRSRYAILSAFAFWVVTTSAAERLLPQRPVPRIGIEVLLSAALLAYWVWFEGWRRFLRETVPLFVIVFAIFTIAHRVIGWSDQGFVGLFWYVLLWMAALLVHGLYLKLIGADDTGDRPSTALRVKAAELAGVVEYDTMRLSGIHVEELAADWVQQLSEAKTDENGRFALPVESSAPVHWVRVSWPGTETVHLQVELSPDAQPLLVRLKPRKWKSMAYLGR